AAAPAASYAQTKDDPENFVHDVLRPIFGPHWNVFIQSGVTTTGRFLLQTPGIDRERALESRGGFNVGGGAGVDVLTHVGFRTTYSYSSSELVFRTNNGDDSRTFDADNVGTLNSHIA